MKPGEFVTTNDKEPASKVKRTKLEITKIKKLENMKPGEFVSISKVFGVPILPGKYTLKSTKELIKSSKRIDMLLKISGADFDDLFYCFDKQSQFVCTHFELSSNAHSLLPPTMVGSTPTDSYSYRDRVKLLIQLSLVEDGILNLPWSYLTAAQMVSGASWFQVKNIPKKGSLQNLDVVDKVKKLIIY